MMLRFLSSLKESTSFLFKRPCRKQKFHIFLMKSPAEDGFFDGQRGRWEPSHTRSNLIQITRDFVSQYSEEERMEKAREHVIDALRYKGPRFDILNSNEPKFYKTVYQVQTYTLWELIMAILSFVYMYMIVFESTDLNSLYQVGSPVIYCIFILDFIMQTLHQSYDQTSHKSRFSTLFLVKVLTLVLVGVDEVLIGLNVQAGTRPIHPFRIMRVVLPIIYNREIRRSFQSLGSAYKDIFVYFIFYSVVIVAFAVTTSQLIGLPNGVEIDEYKNDYKDLSKMIFIMYVTGTYDAYPDNQLPAIRAQTSYYAIFIFFIFLNMFIFSSIPGSLIFEKFRDTRAKLQLLDETKMQNSLIVAFITLGQDNFQMDIHKMGKFLLYFYQNRVRFIDTVTSICLKLNPNDHTSIHINEFMQLGRILQENSNLRPPMLADWPTWISFRRFINSKLKLKQIVNSWGFKFFSSLIVIGGFSNAFLFLYYGNSINGSVDNIFANIFMVELLVKIIAIGPECYFGEIFSGADFSLVVFGFFFQFFTSLTDQDALLRMFRIFRASFLLQTLICNRFWTIDIKVYQNLTNLFVRMATILPIIMKFLPLYLLTYYVLGVLGMQTFYGAYQMEPSPEYSFYDEYSNFRCFIDTQLYFVQVLTEAGWSSVAFDVAKRIPDYFGLVMIFFATFHIIIVLILATLIKGIIWSTFITVSAQYEDNKRYMQAQKDRRQNAKIKFTELDMLDHIVHKIDRLKLDSVVKREVYQHKMNQQVLNKLRKINKNKKLARKSTKDAVHQTLYRNFDINMNILKQEELMRNNGENTQKYLMQVIEKFTRERLQDEHCGLLDPQDFEERIQKICKKMRSSVEKGISMEIKDCELLNGHLASKLQTPCSLKATSKKSNDPNLHIFDMHILLGMNTTWREQKTLVICGLIERGVIENTDGNQLLHKSVGVKGFRLDQDCTIRKTYLQGTRPKLIEKFQAEYFGNIYGKAFKQINKVTIEPLIKLESTMVYALKNICRYPHMSMQQFFRLLSKVENMISNQLLKNGSLFKFVFQLNCDKNIWFSIRFDGKNSPHLSFLKHGLWLYNSTLEEHEIYYAKDLFRFEKQYIAGDLLERANLVKKLYETFESLALTLQGKDSFFESNPQYHVYDTFFTYLNVEPIQRLIQRQLQISKVMVVLLTKEKERASCEEIPFQVSQIPIEKFEAQVQFKLDETQSQTFKKLTHLASMNDQQVTAREGLPFSYVLNFLQEINDILRLHSPNFIHHVENLLNSELQQPK